LHAQVLALHILKKRERLAERTEGTLHTGLAVRLGRGVLRLEQRANGLRDVLDDAEDLLRNVLVLLQCLECFAERFASLSRFGRR
jgi:hypothetical protein